MESWRREFYFMHVGKSKLDGAKIGSGRYPLGSGKNPRAAMKAKASFSLFKRKKEKETHNFVDKDARSNYADEDAWTARKNKAVRTGDVKFVKRYINDFEPNEIKAVNSNFKERATLNENYAKAQKSKYANILKFMEKATSTMEKVNKLTNELDKGAKFVSKLTGTKLPKFDLDESTDKKQPDNHIKKQVANNSNQVQQQNQSKAPQKKDLLKEAGITLLTPDEYYNAKLIEALTNSSGGSSGWNNYDMQKWKNYRL